MLLEPLVSAIETIKARIATHGTALRENEIRTRMALIDPLLQSLGWDTSDPSLVLPEFDVSGRKADYALLENDGNPAATLEAKKLGEPLSSHRMQMLNYSNASGVEYAGLTDGDKWELYEVFKRGQLEDRRVLDISIADSPAHESALKLLLLWRPNLASAQPIAASAPLLVETEEPILERRSSDSSSVRQPSSDDWVSLTDVEARMKDKNPVAIRFLGDEQRPVRNRREVLIQSAEWLVQTGRLTAANLPKGPGWNFINTSPHTSNGRDFRSPREISGGIFVDVSVRKRGTLIELSGQLHHHFGVNPETVELRFE